MLAALAPRDPEHSELFQTGQWPEIRDQIENHNLRFPPLERYFSAIEEQGILFFNATWTHTREEDVGAQLDLWRPLGTESSPWYSRSGPKTRKSGVSGRLPLYACRMAFLTQPVATNW